MRRTHLSLTMVSACLFTMPAVEAVAGDFQALPSTGTDIRIRGTNNQATDPLFVATSE